MNAYDVMTRFGIRPEAWAAMRRDTLEVLGITGEVVGLAVRGSTSEEDDDEFYYDVDWNQWFKVTYPGRSITGSMAPVDGDTEGAFIWFIALD